MQTACGAAPRRCQAPGRASSRNRCSGNASCPGRGQAGEALSSHTVSQPVQQGEATAAVTAALPSSRARPPQAQGCSLGWAGCGGWAPVHPAGCWQGADDIFTWESHRPSSPRRGAHGWSTSGKRSACLCTSPEHGTFLHLLRPCLSDRTPSPRWASPAKERGTVTPV